MGADGERRAHCRPRGHRGRGSLPGPAADRSPRDPALARRYGRRGPALLLALLLGAGAGADTISFGFRPMPPYVMTDEKGRLRGLEYEIVVAALAAKGHSVAPVLFPLARLVETLKNKGVQGAAPILASHNTGAFLSLPYIVYDNVAMTLASSGISLSSVEDLGRRSIMAFQTARSVLGPDFDAAAARSPLYVEEARQVVQIKALFAGRTEVVIGDSRILRWYIGDPATGIDRSKPVREFRLFPPTRYSAAFLDPQLARDFDQGLSIIMRNGLYDRIIANYGP